MQSRTRGYHDVAISTRGGSGTSSAPAGRITSTNKQRRGTTPTKNPRTPRRTLRRPRRSSCAMAAHVVSLRLSPRSSGRRSSAFGSSGRGPSVAVRASSGTRNKGDGLPATTPEPVDHVDLSTPPPVGAHRQSSRRRVVAATLAALPLGKAVQVDIQLDPVC